MSKELVISSNRHETKVAILEDDQLVEIYFQRANEYSLAGSVHKGRVTRVLPGMQSAFVDLGLERDTFLYVSDFFEENEDLDLVEGGSVPLQTRGDRPERSERGERPERGGDRERRERPEQGDRGDRGERGERPRREEPLVLSAGAALPVEAAAIESAPEAPALRIPPAGRPPEEGGDRGGDRGGRRGRRRRRGGRGFPDSKYAATPETRSEPTLASGSVESEDEAEPILLPGESLAKYRGTEGAEEADSDAGSNAHSAGVDDDLDLPVGSISSETPEELPPANAIPDAPRHLAPLHTEVVAQTEVPVRPPVEEPVIEEPVAEVQAASEPAHAEEPAHFPEPLEYSAQHEEDGAVEEADEVGEDEPSALSLPGLDEDEDREIQELILNAGGDSEHASEEAPPASGSASVREQSGGRYLQRGGRRMRRGGGGRMRGGDPAGPPRERSETPRGEHGEQRPDPRSEQRSEQRTERPDHRPASRPERAAVPSITDLLKEGQEIIVQIAKEPLGQKGARITSHIALPGRYVVYMPTLDHMGVSRKVSSDEERQRLKRILQKHRVGIAGGYIMRTAGEGKTEDEIAADMTFLANLWLDMRQKAEKNPAPVLLHHDLDIVQRILRDQVNDSFKSVWVDNEEMYESILRFVQRFQPTMVSRIKLYTRPAPIFDAFNISAELEKALRPKVWLKSGGYIVINQTEALVAIDINTGKYVGKSNRLEDTIVKTNTEAVKEIVRQVRLRDLGGIIVIDFIDMDERKNRQKVMQALEDAMRSDRAPSKILQFNDFGLVAITRKRVKQSLERTLCAPCPYCEGAGYVKSVQTIIGEILQEAHKIAKAVEGSDSVLRVHPDVAKLLKSNQNRFLEELEEILKVPVLVKSDPTLHHEKFDLA